MARTKTNPATAKKRSQKQIEADERYTQRNRENNRRNQAANYKNISATIRKARAEAIAATFKAHGVTVAEVVSAAAEQLKADGQNTAQAIKASAAAFNARYEREEHAAAPAPQPADSHDE